MSFTDDSLIWESPYVERYCYQICDQVIGASLGVETYFIKIHWAVSGEIHGYPVTYRELYEEIREMNPDILEVFAERARHVPH